MTRTFVIAIDGHAGAGKSTLAKELARSLGYIHLDTGALYRAVAYLAVSHEIPENSDALLGDIAATHRFEFRRRSPEEAPCLHINDVDRSREIRQPEVEKRVPDIAALPSVRRALTESMRLMAQNSGVVAEGRDIGTVVLPGADIKVFMTASLEVRGTRIQGALRKRGVIQELKQVMIDIAVRDKKDESREIAPLKPAADATILDTSDMNEREVLEWFQVHVRSFAPTTDQLPRVP